MAGTIPLSLTQQFDIYGKPLAGGLLYLIAVGTVSTPQDSFQDTALTIKMPYPIPLDAAGRVPQFFLADGSIKIRLQDKAGVVQLAADSILVIGPSAGGGGGGAVDPTQLIQMGNMIFRYGVGVLGGYVRMNGRTIGSATSGATERANADCQSLFQYLWGVDGSLAVSGGRGANAAADWTANKTIVVPDFRGIVPAGMDDMGSTSANRLTGSFWGGNGTILGSFGGNEAHLLTLLQTPPHFHTGSGNTGVESAPHNHNYNNPTSSGAQKPAGTGTAPIDGSANALTGTENQQHTHPFSVTTDVQGGGGYHPNAQPTKVVTFYLKL